MEKTIAFFDFDGTITRKDSMVEFIKFSMGVKAFNKSLAILSPWLIGMKLGLIPNAFAKEKMLAYFFKGMPVEEFNSLCKKFSEDRLPSMIRLDAMETIIAHKKNGDEIVVVSASVENWISHWCNMMNLKFLGTRLEIDENQKLTGKLKGANCNGKEKVNRIISSYDPAGYKTIYCYGDTTGDKEMLSLATHPHYKYFKN